MTSGVNGTVSMSGTVSQLLGGTASKIDTKSLIESLMKAKSIPQDQLKDALEHQQLLSDNLRELNHRMQAVTKAAQGITDIAFNGVPTTASTSLDSVVASSSGGAIAGSSTFHIDSVAAAQISTVKADVNGDLVADYTQGIDITIGGTAHHIDLASGSAADIANAVNGADIGLRAAVVNTDGGQIVQFSSTKTGTDNAFTATGFTQGANPIVTATDAKISVGTGAGAYSISSATNTFTDVMPGVTFTVSAGAVGKDVAITVGDDVDALAAQVQSLVDAINTAKGGVKQLTGKGGLLQGQMEITSLGLDLASVVSTGTADRKSYSTFGIDMDKNGVVSFDAAAFKAAYQTDSVSALAAIKDGFAQGIRDVSEAASLPVIGTLAQAITAKDAKIERMNVEVSNWDDRLDKMHDRLVMKFTAMQTAMASLQSQGDWLTSVFKSMNGDD